MAKKRGATVKDMYWTLGSRDTVVVFEAPDDETAAALVMSVRLSATFARRRCAPSRSTK